MPDPEFLVMHSPGASLVLECPAGEAPLWRYWGPRLPDEVAPGPALRATRPEPSFSLHFDQPLSLFPGLGHGWFGASALLAHRAGTDWTLRIDRCTIERPDPARARVVMQDSVAQVSVTVALWLDPATDGLTVQTTLTNHGDSPLEVQWLAAAVLPLPVDAREVQSYGGRHNGEFVELRDALGRAGWRRENRRGLTSHDCFPGALVHAADGSCHGAQLAWSGNHVQAIDWLDDGRHQWQLGEWLAPGEVRLAPGESVTTPEVLAATSAAGADGVAQAFHRMIRARGPWGEAPVPPRPVHLNTWEGFYFNHDEAELCDLAEAAAAIGIERFVLDDGWFHRRDDDTRALGDWWPDAAKYPNGLGPLARRVTALGMEFGLWVEPEMINPDSELYRTHPDWVLATPGYPLLAARNQLVLNMALPEVRDHLFERIAALLGELPIAYLKWDHNRDLSHAGAQASYRAQVLGAYALIDRLRTAFPTVEIEACAGGGGRIDAGIASRTHRFWTSDNIDAASRVTIQRGFLRFMPPEWMGAHVGACPAHATGRMQTMAYRAGVALPGHFGVELDPRKLGEAERAELAAAIARYKGLRQRFHQGALWQGESGDGVVWQAHGTPHELLLLVTRTRPTSLRHAPQLRLPMADPARRYRISREGVEAVVLDGAWLARVG
ncbi:MAG: alpha-galactosidase, partial [Proteobacteria bacterium]|nr:alpha-galactosidase [Pseudomonadota bacterium]